MHLNLSLRLFFSHMIISDCDQAASKMKTMRLLQIVENNQATVSNMKSTLMQQ